MGLEDRKIIMLAAGRLTYWQGWIFGGVNFALLIVNYLLLREDHPGGPGCRTVPLEPGSAAVGLHRFSCGVPCRPGHPPLGQGDQSLVNTASLPGRALIPQAVAAAFLLARTCLEDRLLLNGLPGYAEYAKQVKH
jgi:hypothetical protein